MQVTAGHHITLRSTQPGKSRRHNLAVYGVSDFRRRKEVNMISHWLLVHLTWNEAEDMACDRSYRRQAAAKCALQHGRN